ncbi:sensor histidine kinase [Muricomes sp. OA1]|uniref:Sensor histidine kinase n=3 Tax=Lachnospiraceae TaxID=186803 RepID=A0A3E2WX99_9FIRM|nr:MULTISPECIES: sensor histidine kinase [Clostridia]MCH1971384.1 sensor histidine kinase [Muricomes sp. OA1]RGC32646.1 sensor histidine kinase [Hungatella hathewayi]GKH34680.1 histidine kinase [Faecalicatena contorta]
MFRSFKKQLTAFTIGFVLAIAVIMALLCYRFIYQNIISVSVQYNNQIANQLCKNIELFMEGIDEQIESVAYSSEIRFFGSHFITPGISSSRSDVKKVLWSAATQQNGFDDISIIYNGKKMISLFNMYDEKSLLELCDYYDKSEVYLNARFVPLIHSNNNGHYSLSCIKSVSNSSVTSGYYVIGSIIIDDIFEMLNNVDLGDGSGACLVDANGSVQYSTLVEGTFTQDMTNLIQTTNFKKDSGFTARLNRENYIISVYPLNHSDLSTVVYIPLSNVTKAAAPLLYTMLTIIFLFLIVSIVISVKLSNRLTYPVTALAVHVRNWDGCSNQFPKVKGTEETDILYHSFQKMTEHIQLLMEKNAQENRQKRKAELLALQAQINPHFLYNTLDSINALAILNDDQDISNMTTFLAHLLRLSIGQPDEFVTIDDEIKHIKAYLTIQKIRYNDKFDVEFHVDSSIGQFPIIRLILQPLIENCIYHGFETKEGKGHIIISAGESAGQIVIQIMDDGLGTDPVTEKEIQNNLASVKKPGNGCSVGIYNVNERLRLYYGDKSSLTFHSVQNKETVVTIRLPKEKGEL